MSGRGAVPGKTDSEKKLFFSGCWILKFGESLVKLRYPSPGDGYTRRGGVGGDVDMPTGVRTGT